MQFPLTSTKIFNMDVKPPTKLNKKGSVTQLQLGNLKMKDAVLLISKFVVFKRIPQLDDCLLYSAHKEINRNIFDVPKNGWRQLTEVQHYFRFRAENHCGTPIGVSRLLLKADVKLVLTSLIVQECSKGQLSEILVNSVLICVLQYAFSNLMWSVAQKWN